MVQKLARVLAICSPLLGCGQDLPAFEGVFGVELYYSVDEWPIGSLEGQTEHTIWALTRAGNAYFVHTKAGNPLWEGGQINPKGQLVFETAREFENPDCPTADFSRLVLTDDKGLFHGEAEIRSQFVNSTAFYCLVVELLTRTEIRAVGRVE